MRRIEFNDIIRVCAEVNQFTKKADMIFKALPVLEFEFASMNAFMDSRMEFLQAIEPQLIAATGKGRRVDDYTEEFDCYGVTVRLICRERSMTKHGSAADIAGPVIRDNGTKR